MCKSNTKDNRVLYRENIPNKLNAKHKKKNQKYKNKTAEQLNQNGKCNLMGDVFTKIVYILANLLNIRIKYFV